MHTTGLLVVLVVGVGSGRKGCLLVTRLAELNFLFPLFDGFWLLCNVDIRLWRADVTV